MSSFNTETWFTYYLYRENVPQAKIYGLDWMVPIVLQTREIISIN